MKKIIAMLLAMLLMFAFSACKTNDYTLTPGMLVVESTDDAMLEEDEQPSLGYQPKGDEKSTISTKDPAESIAEYYGSTDPEWIKYVDENVVDLGTWAEIRQEIRQEDYDSKVWEYYLAEIQNRMNNSDYWSGCEQEEEFLDDMGYTTFSEYQGIHGYLKDDTGYFGACPVVYKTSDEGVGFMYISKYGTWCLTNPNAYYSAYDNVHVQGQCNLLNEGMTDEEAVVADLDIGRGYNFTAVYRKATQTFEMWCFGEVVRSYQLPMDAVFVGVSDTEGYLFKAGTDLYVVRDYTEDYYSSPNDEENFAFELIASDVRAVLADDYFWDLTGFGEDDIDYSSQPFLLMNNGELKVYVHDAPNVPANDPSNLKDWRGDAIH